MPMQSKQKNELLNRMRDEIRQYEAEHKGQVSLELVKKLYHMVFEATFREVLDEGAVKLPSGLGRLVLRRMANTRRRHPVSGKLHTIDRERLKIRYVNGAQIKRLLGYGSDYKYELAGPRPIELGPPKSGV